MTSRFITKRLVIAAPAGWQSPSARDRLGPLARSGHWQVDAVATGTFPAADQMDSLLQLAGQDAALVLQRVMPDPGDVERLRRSYQHLIFDLDDAIYAVPPDFKSPWPISASRRVVRLVIRGSPTASSRKRPLERTLARVDACVVGNSILDDFVRRHAPRVVEIPTTFEPFHDPPATRPQPPIVVWHGLQGSLQHLVLVREALRALANDVDFRVQIIASATWQDAPIPIEFVPWSPEALREGLLTASVGLAPLTDDVWTRGKCAFRAIQYGAHGVPTVASPVGITDRVVLHGRTGYLARSTSDWEWALRELLTNPDVAAVMGAHAHRHIGENYSDKLAIERWHLLIDSLDRQ